MGDYRQLKAWQHADRLAAICRKAARHLPVEERFALADQMRRASDSVSLNIAEGASKPTLRSRLQQMYTARSSLDEVGAILSQIRRANYLTPLARQRLAQVHAECTRTLGGLIKALRRRL